MHPVLRIALYVVLAASAVFFGYRFMQGYADRMDRAAHRYESEMTSAPVEAEPASDIALESTNALPPAADIPPETEGDSDTAAASINEVATEGEGATTNAPPPPAAASTPPSAAALRSGGVGIYAALALGAVIGLALLVASDVSHYMGLRAQRALYSDEGEHASSPEYDQAEQAWANGDHMEALRLLRDHLNRHPRQLHAAFRIAEIYEKDLGNHLAAALEYEEILKHKLAPDRWGWSAIHLCNLYNRIGQFDKTEALLRQIVDEYGETPAAKKARERLGIPEASPLAGPAESEPQPAAGPQLPPGFRPKKKR
ncbi:MAG: hypothetical protein KA191_12290 [Verrucomicrobia bacterium]|jgi:TolA-binding protein|nr:hypothetical protein [Verrucomicrobiota bacterium]OQC64102.1 MAG: hypothetical protein BWX48_02911 [Verrucomicrobia bacterium ADurb.Bin006]MDI9379731.1 hypothetical protein [Verrucomicrobiota bacterium]NMD19394.1 hypothetical protein [Verrucomicrobiota bacterium]HNU99749.1 hypothetical protein [Verrucomicrobiota bacterium]